MTISRSSFLATSRIRLAWLIGGPMADPMANGLAADFMFFNPVQFNPALPNGTMTTAEGVALFKRPPRAADL